MKKLSILLIIIIATSFTTMFASDDLVLQNIANIRRDFFNSKVNWEEFASNGDTKIGSTNVYISVKHILPRRILRSDFAKIITDLQTNKKASQTLEQYYKEGEGVFTLDTLTDGKHIQQIAKIFKQINYNNYDYAVTFYTDEQKSKTGSFGTFNYLFDSNGTLYECRVNYQQETSSYILFNVDRPKRCDVYLFGNLSITLSAFTNLQASLTISEVISSLRKVILDSTVPENKNTS